jgi:hypothetical protein
MRSRCIQRHIRIIIREWEPEKGSGAVTGVTGSGNDGRYSKKIWRGARDPASGPDPERDFQHAVPERGLH